MKKALKQLVGCSPKYFEGETLEEILANMDKLTEGDYNGQSHFPTMRKRLEAVMEIVAIAKGEAPEIDETDSDQTTDEEFEKAVEEGYEKSTKIHEESKSIRAYMMAHFREHVDENGEVIEEQLAQDTAKALGHEEWLQDDKHEVWNIAVEISLEN